MEPLLVVEVGGRGSLSGDRSTGEDVVRNCVVVVELQGTADDRVKAGNDRAESLSAGESDGAGANTACSRASAARARTDVSVQSTDSSARRVLYNSDIDAEKGV